MILLLFLEIPFTFIESRGLNMNRGIELKLNRISNSNLHLRSRIYLLYILKKKLLIGIL